MKIDGIPTITKPKKGSHNAWTKGFTPHEKEMITNTEPVIIYQDKALVNRVLAKYGMC